MNKRWKNSIYGSLMAAMILGSMPTNVMAEEAITKASSQAAEEFVVKNDNAVVTDNAVVDDAEISEEQALEIAKKVVGDIEGYSSPDIFRRNDRYNAYDERNVWDINWNKPGPKYAHISVSIDAKTGFIRSFYRSNSEQDKMEFPPKVKYEDAVDIAEKLVKDIYGDKASNLKYDERPYDEWGKIVRNANDRYNVNFVELINGVPFPRNSVNMQIDGNGKVISFNYSNMSNVEFADKNGLLGKETLLKMLNDKFTMRLAYVNSISGEYQNIEDKKVYLSYQPNYPSYFTIDAKTGDFLDYSGNVMKEYLGSEEPLADKAYPVEPARKGDILTKEEALQKLKDVIDIPEDVNITSSTLDKSNRFGSNQSWRFQFEYRRGNGASGWTGGVVDAVTGDILQMDKSVYFREKIQEKLAEQESVKLPKKNKEYALSEEDAKVKAIAFLKEHSKSKLNQLYESPMSSSTILDPYYPTYNFSFERRINDIAVMSNRVNVSISAETGEIVNFYQNWDYDLKLPEIKEVITPEQAKQVYLNNLNLRMEYNVPAEQYSYYYRNDGKWPEGDLEPLEAMLVYRNSQILNQPNFLDANTGKFLNLMTGEEISTNKEKEVATDIAGHWAEKELNYLLEIKAIEKEDGLVKPNEVLNRGQFVDTLRKVFESYRSYYPYQEEGKASFKDVNSDSKYYISVEWAKQRGLLEEGDNFRPEDHITREEAANILVNALGYGKLADESELFNLNFKDDKDIDYKGPVAIVDQLGIMNGVNEKFMPDKPLTKAETAVIFYRFLDKRNEFQVTNVPLY